MNSFRTLHFFFSAPLLIKKKWTLKMLQMNDNSFFFFCILIQPV